MKVLILYYSQTGNTKKIAMAIKEGMEMEGAKVEIMKIKDAKAEDLDKYELVGIGSPVWDGAEPPNVRRFIEELPKQKDKKAFLFCTHGVMPEHYFPFVARRLKNKGFLVIGMRDWFGSVYLQITPSPYYTDGHPDEIDLAEAREFGKEMIEKSERIKKGELDLVSPLPPYILTPQLLVLSEFFRWGHNAHGRLTYNPDLCKYPNCRLCIDHCIMEYIDFSKSERRFGSGGTYCDMWLGCTFCELICPTGAISCDWEAFLKVSSEVLSIFESNPLEEAAKNLIQNGKLRLLVPFEEIRWDRLFFMVHNKRPRLKIRE